MGNVNANLTPGVQAIYQSLVLYLFDPAIALLFALGLLVFVWGLIQFLWNFNKGSKDVDEGKMHMLWGLLGMFIMLASWGIVSYIASFYSITL